MSSSSSCSSLNSTSSIISISSESDSAQALEIVAPSFISRLPPELIGHIIHVSLPPVTPKHARERYDLLVSYSLVDSVWREFAQKELFAHVMIQTRFQNNQFAISTFDQEFATRIMKMLRTIHWNYVPSFESEDFFVNAVNFSRATQLDLVQLVGGDVLGAPHYDPWIENLGQKLSHVRRLRIYNFHLYMLDSETNSGLPNLTSLSIAGPFRLKPYARFMEECHNLRRITLADIHPDDDLERFRLAVAGKGAQLVSFSWAEDFDEIERILHADSIWKSLTAIETLTIPDQVLINSQIIRLIPSTLLTRIRLICCIHVGDLAEDGAPRRPMNQIIGSIYNHANFPALSNLKRLTILTHSKSAVVHRIERKDEFDRNLKFVCEKLKIVLDWIQFENWEPILYLQGLEEDNVPGLSDAVQVVSRVQ